jgi:aspartyl-tRNA(Asn)/glutamyl-tRNA(Gln) amidotransferase subunit A
MARTLIQTVEAIASGRLRPSDAVEEALDAVAEWQPHTRLTSQVWEDEARELAAALGDRPVGPLHGVPVMVKDLYDVQGHPTTGCSRAFEGRMAEGTSPLVYRLRRAGAIVIGKTNQHELAAGGTNHVSACGPTRNPWDPERLTGGSSGGSAAAVACGAVPLALGSDTGGSIRIPASFCGVVALKPTHGRLPLHGMMPLAPTMDSPGPMAPTVLDVTLAFALLDGEAPDAVPGPVEGMRVGVPRSGLYAGPVHPEVRAGLDHTAEVLAASGAEIVDGSVEGIDDAPEVWNHIAWPEFTAAYPDLDLDLIDPRTRRLYELGRDLPEAERNEARFRRAAVRAAFARALEGCDALLLPATGFAAPRADEEQVDVGDRRTMDVYRGGCAWFTRPVNLAGLPALSFVTGFDGRGLPLGAQLVGPERSEWALLRLGAAFERDSGVTGREPALPV